MSIPDLSVTIITRNEARRIARCLRSVSFADEIVVVDSGSDDDTVRIAREAGASVTVTSDWPGFGRQKNRALDLAHGRWILSIDADEVVTPQLRDEILAVVRETSIGGDSPRAWWLRRASTFRGRRMRHGDWSNDRVLRLFLREAGRFSDDVVHERVVCDGRQGTFRGLLLHDTIESIDDAHRKVMAYALAGAERLRARGRGGMASALLHAIWTFIRGFVLRGGLFDGREGWQLARCNALGTYLRYRFAGMDGGHRTQFARTWSARMGLGDPGDRSPLAGK